MKTLLFGGTLILLVINLAFTQNYSSHPLITFPGNNYDVDVLSPVDAWPKDSTYICWVNESDSIYTIYLKQIAPTIREEIIVASDSSQKSNPQIVRNGQSIRIAWQNRMEGEWQIWFRTFEDEVLGSGVIFTDSLANDPEITMNSNRIAWVDSGNILIKEYIDDLNETVVLDSSNCSSPSLGKDDNYRYSKVLYEKGLQSNKDIFLAELNKYVSPEWKKTKLTDGPGLSPRFGFLEIVSFQLYQDNLWSILHDIFFSEPFDTIKISGCNLRDPVAFSYNIPTIDNSVITHPFVVFEKDSIETEGSDIFIKTFNSVFADTFVNVSKVAGKNYQPDITYLAYPDSPKIAVIWIHEIEGKKDIWISESLYNPVIGDIEETLESIQSFTLKQNYPNPFNPVTNIEYFILKPSRVSLTIYNVLGETIKIFNEGLKTVGMHKIQFNGQNYPSGVYYYKLSSGNYSITRPMMLLK